MSDLHVARAPWRVALVWGALWAAASSVFAAGAPAPAVRFSHPLAAVRTVPRSTATAPDTITVVAGRIEFPFESPDNTFTTGRGVFDTTAGPCTYVDAPPHNGVYFSRHLEFLKNYVAAASAGRSVVKIAFVPNPAVAPHTMGEYAPPTDSPDNHELVNLIDDAWTAIDAANPTFDFAGLDPARTMYVLFHAGVGRDIDLSSQFGYNPQPQDLPSLYFSLEALQKARGTGYAGVPLHGGARVTNTAVIPETETRIISDKRTDLGLNGLLCSSLGSFVGLPDLFNTTYGWTGIGRFGLMDVASIFAFHGLFPPLPNAWERASLGWVTPVDITTSSTPQHTLVAAQVARAADTTVAKVMINDREYFLIENRQRNPDSRGIDVQIACDSVSTFHFTTDVYGFTNVDISALSGVVTGCSNFDWGIAGSGILIWHVDENIISANLATNTVNGQGHVRGVRLMEADGAQNIGVPVTTPFGTYISDGYDGDAWQRGNEYNFPRYSNVFSDTTQPDAHSNANTATGIRIYDFDTTQSHMKFSAVREAEVRLAAGFPQRVGADPGTNPVVVADVNHDHQEEIFLATPTALLAWKPDGSALIAGTDPVAVFAAEPGIVSCPTIDTSTGNVFAVSQYNGVIALTGWKPVDADRDGRADTLFRRVLNVVAPRTVLVPMVLDGRVLAIVDTMLFVFDENGAQISARSIRGGRANMIDAVVSAAAVEGAGGKHDADRMVVDEYGIRATMVNLSTGDAVWSTPINVWNKSTISVGDVYGDTTAAEIIVNCLCGKTVILDHAGAILATRMREEPTTGVKEPPMASNIAIGEGQTMMLSGTSHVFAENTVGAALTNFPKAVAAGLTGAPLIISRPDLVYIDQPWPEHDGPAIYAATTDGLLHLFPTHGCCFPTGFPLALGSAVNGAPAIATNRLYAATSGGYLYGFEGQGYFAPNNWSQFMHDAAHTNFAPRIAVAAAPTVFFPKDRVFNWPNPVRNKFTHIRFFVATNATAHVKITNLANELVMDLPEVNATGGVDNEIELKTGEMQSGVYIVRVEVKGVNGESDVAFVKMAVIN